MKSIKVALLASLAAAVGVFVAAAATVLFLAALAFGTAWRICDAVRKRCRPRAVKGKGKGQGGQDTDRSWELLP